MRLLAAGGACVAAGLLAGCGRESAKPFAIDETTGRVGPVEIGDTRAAVVAALGKPSRNHSGFLPRGEYYEEIGGPPIISVPGPGEILRYPHLGVMLQSGRVYAMIVSGKARTRAGPGIGDSLADVKRAFSHGECGTLGAESGGEIPYCSFPVPAGRITFGKDPVRSITLTKRPR
jgi:hypothetical protein